MHDVVQEYRTVLKDLSATMLGVCRESVGLIKRSDQAVGIHLTQRQEWDVYLEFLKILFNLVDRASLFYVPVQRQPEFMNGLEDHVSHELKTALGHSLSDAQIDEQEIVVSVGQAVAESRHMYERHTFVFSEDSKERRAFFQHASERIAARAGAADNQGVRSAATLCISAVIPAITALFEGKDPETKAASPEPTTEETPSPASTAAAPRNQAIKLISVVASTAGEECETRWGLFPHFRRDLTPEQVTTITGHMNRVAQIVGDRFAVASSKRSDDSTPHVGNA